MIFELKFECRGFENELAFFLQQVLNHYTLEFRIFGEKPLVVWIEYDASQLDLLEEMISKLSHQVPQSFYQLDVCSKNLENEVLPNPKQTFLHQEHFGYCPECLNTQEGDQCKICQKIIPASCMPIYEEIYTLLTQKQGVKLLTSSGEHFLSLEPSERVYCLNLDAIWDIAHLSAKELKALASYEKPIVRVSSHLEWNLDGIEVLISIAHDLELLKLFTFLKEKNIPYLFGTKQWKEEFFLAPCVGNPKEILILENDDALVLKDAMPQDFLQFKFKEHKYFDKAFLATIIEENSIADKNILHFHFSHQGEDKICLYNAHTQWFNTVMNFELPKDLETLFAKISLDSQSGSRLIENYTQAFSYPKNVSFESYPKGIFGIWEIARVVLEIDEDFLSLARKNLTQRGVAIEYSFSQDSLIAHTFHLVECIRSGMSFRLAGAENGIIALGYIESFSLLFSKLYLQIRKLIEIDGLSLSGDLFSSKMLGDFVYRNNRQVPLYRNISFPLLYAND